MRKVCLQNKGGRTYIFSGWSSSGQNANKDKCKFTKVQHVSKKDCKKEYKNFTYPGTKMVFDQLDVNQHFICAKVHDEKNEKGICFDDSNAGGKFDSL